MRPYLLGTLDMVYSVELGTISVLFNDSGLKATHLTVTLLQLSAVRSIEKFIV